MDNLIHLTDRNHIYHILAQKYIVYVTVKKPSVDWRRETSIEILTLVEKNTVWDRLLNKLKELFERYPFIEQAYPFVEALHRQHTESLLVNRITKLIHTDYAR